MDFSVDYNQAANKEDAFDRVQEKITPDYIAKFKVTADVNYKKADSHIVAEGKGFTLTMDFSEKSVAVALKLSLVLRPFKKTILGTIEEKLKRAV